jgi:hypothetical protein
MRCPCDLEGTLSGLRVESSDDEGSLDDRRAGDDPPVRIHNNPTGFLCPLTSKGTRPNSDSAPHHRPRALGRELHRETSEEQATVVGLRHRPQRPPAVILTMCDKQCQHCCGAWDKPSPNPGHRCAAEPRRRLTHGFCICFSFERRCSSL